MINARRMAGIHNESTMTENAGSGFYEATVQGKYGSVVLYLGSSATKAAPAGYTEGAKGSGYAMYYTGNGPQDVEEILKSSNPQILKYIRDGQLYIECNGNTYNANGQLVK